MDAAGAGLLLRSERCAIAGEEGGRSAAVIVAGDDLQDVAELMARDKKRLNVMEAVRPLAENLEP